MSEWKKYCRTGVSEMRPYIPGEDLKGVSVSPEDNPESDHGMVARNPKNHADQWYVARAYFEENFEEQSTLEEEQADESQNSPHNPQRKTAVPNRIPGRGEPDR